LIDKLANNEKGLEYAEQCLGCNQDTFVIAASKMKLSEAVLLKCSGYNDRHTF
jgi:hypothetical protein